MAWPYCGMRTGVNVSRPPYYGMALLWHAHASPKMLSVSSLVATYAARSSANLSEACLEGAVLLVFREAAASL
eukprot:6950529-Prymnesium_polylepis.3